MSSQYDLAKENATRLKNLFPRIIFTGHSQGGGEAALCAYYLGAKAVTFNPAGLSQFTLSKYTSKSRRKNDINYYIYITDLLNIAQQITDYLPLIKLLPDGKGHYIIDKIPKKLSISEFHGMEGFLNYLNIPYENKR